MNCQKCGRPFHKFHDCILNPVANPDTTVTGLNLATVLTDEQHTKAKIGEITQPIKWRVAEALESLDRGDLDAVRDMLAEILHEVEIAKKQLAPILGRMRRDDSPDQDGHPTFTEKEFP